MSHPNTIAALIAGGLGTLTGYLLNKYTGVHITDVQAGGIVTGYTAVLLFVGRRGVKGAVRAAVSGVWNGPPKPAAKPKP
jgi:hypothetical protein